MSLKKSYPTSNFNPVTAYQSAIGTDPFIQPNNVILDDDSLTSINLSQNEDSYSLELKYNYNVDSGIGYGQNGDIEGFEITFDGGGAIAGGSHKVILRAKAAGKPYITIASGELSSLGINSEIGSAIFGTNTNISSSYLSSSYLRLSSGTSLFLELSALNSSVNNLTLSADSIKLKVYQIPYNQGRPIYKRNQLRWLGYF